MAGTLDGIVAVVTGGSRGIGKGIALGLGEAGATVYVTGRSAIGGSTFGPGTVNEAAVSLGEAVILPATVRDGGAACVLGELRLRAAVEEGPAEVMIRPEQIAILGDEMHEGVAARVLGVSYFGHDALVRLALDDGPVVVGRPPGCAAPRAGTDVRLAVRGDGRPSRRARPGPRLQGVAGVGRGAGSGPASARRSAPSSTAAGSNVSR